MQSAAKAQLLGSTQEPEQTRQELSAQLERQARIFDATLSSIIDFAYIFDLDGRFLYANKALLDLWGITLDQAVGKNFYDLKYPEPLAAKLQRQIQQVIDTRQGVSDETPYTSPTGAGGYYEYIFSPVLAADGSVEAVAGCTRDLTERKRAEMLAEAQKQSLELVAGGKPLAEILSFLTNIVEEQSGGQTITAILLLDRAGCLRIGAAPSLPDSYNSAIDGIRASADLGTCSVAAVTGNVVITPDIETDPNWENIKHLPIGLGLLAAWSKPIVARDGRVLGTFGTYFRECRQPTARERQIVETLSHTAALAIERSQADQEREQLLASERDALAEADAANRAKDRFFAVLSHELRTPLSPVVMALPAMESDPDLPPQFREDLAMIRRNIDLEVKLIDDLLDLNRITSGKLRLQMQPTELHEVLRHAIRNSDADAAGKRILIREQFGAASDRLTADPARLQQVFWNLVRNAVKFTPDGGDISVRTWNSQDLRELFVEIKDSGVGIPPQLLSRIFNAFEQGDARMTRQFGGLGLGLAIAKAVVEMHGGTIGAASDGCECGATFTVRLNTLSRQDAAQPRSEGGDPHARPSASRVRVLLVEDHGDTAQMLARILKISGYEVKTAVSVASALQLADSEPFDVVVSDIGLPDASGYELMQQLRDRHGLKGIALSGYGMEDDIRKSRGAGFVDHVVKPVNIEQLKAIIDRATGNGSGGV